MEDEEIIQKVLDQHLVLLDQFNLVGVAMSDRDALLRLEKAEQQLGVPLKKPLATRRNYVIESLKLIALGMEKHYAFEEEMLPFLLSDLLNRALVFEHQVLKRELQKTIIDIGSTNLELLSPAEEINQEARISQSIKAVWSKKLDHQKREDAILLTLEKVVHHRTEHR